MSLSDLVVEMLAIECIKPYERNARTHSDAQVAQICKSITEFGWTNPILIDENFGVIAGHGRLLAACSLSIDVVPCIRLHGLTETQRRAYVIADNQLAINAGWDSEMLKLEIESLVDCGFDCELIGFGDSELHDLDHSDNFAAGLESEQGKLDEKKIITCPSCAYEF